MRCKACDAAAVWSESDRRNVLCRTDDGSLFEVDREAFLGKATGRVADRRALGHHGETPFAKCCSRCTVGIGRITQDDGLVVLFGLGCDKLDGRVPVGSIRRRGDDLGDQLGVGVDRDVRLECRASRNAASAIGRTLTASSHR